MRHARRGRTRGTGQRRLRALVALALTATVGVVLLARSEQPAQAAPNSALIRASVNNFGSQLAQRSDRPSVSADGRFVAFETDQDVDRGAELGTGRRDQNQTTDIYVRDIVRGTTTVVSLFSPGNGGDEDASSDPHMSGDGRFIVFTSRNESAGDIPDGKFSSVYLVDRGAPEFDGGYAAVPAGAPVHVGLDDDESTDFGGSDEVYNASVSDDGNEVAFEVGFDSSDNLVALRDRAAATTEVLDLDVINTEPSLSADGEHLAFTTRPSNFSGFDSRIWVYDRPLDRSVIVTSTELTDDLEGGGTNPEPLDFTRSRTPDISADGRVVAYTFEYSSGSDEYTPSPTLAPGELPTDTQHIVSIERDPFGTGLPTNAVVASRLGTNNEYGNGNSFEPALSDDGRYLAFTTAAPNLSASNAAENFDGSCSLCHVVAIDRALENVFFTPQLVSSQTGNSTPGNGSSYRPAVSRTGRFIAFASDATNLLLFSDTAGVTDVYLLEWMPGLQTQFDPLVMAATPVGGTTTGPQPINVETADFGPWEGGGLFLLGPHDTDFAVDLGACTGQTFHFGEDCTFTVDFSPTAVGTREADILVLRDSLLVTSSAQLEIEVTGQADLPVAVGALDRVSLGSAGLTETGELSDDSTNPALSADGRYVAFEHDEDIDPRDNNFVTDIYVRDTLRDTTTIVSLRSDGTNPCDSCSASTVQVLNAPTTKAGGPPPDSAFNPTISGDGRFIAYESGDTKALEPGAVQDFNAVDIFLVDRGAPNLAGDFTAVPTVELISVDTAGLPLLDNAVDPSISGDGTQVAFRGCISSFSGAGSCEPRVLIRDRDVDGDGSAEGGADIRTTAITPSQDSTGNDRFLRSSQPAISADGDHVAFVGDTFLFNNDVDQTTTAIWVYDRDPDGNGVRDTGCTAACYELVTTKEFVRNSRFGGGPRSPGGAGESRLLEGTQSIDPAIDGDGSTIAYAFHFFSQSDIASDLPADIYQVLVAERSDLNGVFPITEVVSVAGDPAQLLPPTPSSEPPEVAFDQRCTTTNFATTAPTTAPETIVVRPPPADHCSNAGDGDSRQPDVSDDGRYVVFSTAAENLHIDEAVDRLRSSGACDLTSIGKLTACDVLAVDRTAPGNAGAPQLVPIPPDPAFGPSATGDSLVPVLSGDGRFIAFQSDAFNLLGVGSNDCEGPCPVDSNFDTDIFLNEWEPSSTADVSDMLFAETPIGITSAAQSVQVSTLQFGPDPVLEASIGGANPGDFLITGSTNCLPPLANGPAAPVDPVPLYGIVHLDTPCTVTVAFQPTSFGTRSALLTLRTGARPASSFPDQIMTVRLTGGGLGTGGFAVDPATLDFGEEIVTVPSDQQVVTVTNTGNGPFRITAVTIVGTNPGDFTIVTTDCTGRLLNPGERCTVTLQFTPGAPGERTATLRFDDDAAGNPHLVQLTGRAPTPTITVNPAVTIPGRTVLLTGANFAPGRTVLITMVDPFRPTEDFPEKAKAVAGADGRFVVTAVIFPRSAQGTRLVVANGDPAVLVAQVPLLIGSPTVEGPDFVIRG